MSKITIFCIILGDNRAFSVDIEETKTVDHLKDEIKMKRKHDLVGCDAVWLELYQLKGINFDAPYLEKVRKISQDLGGQESPKLDLWLELSTIKGGFPKGMLHILVEPPAGESINSSSSTFERREGSGLGSQPATLSTPLRTAVWAVRHIPFHPVAWLVASMRSCAHDYWHW